ncbi:MAG: single-stranded-DNA-specific exonuclease RecJ [Candidatus Pacebacteria bacterium CG_4_9_14_3_um_filter_40_12]|nr:MAG: single-stranded-DNA-specific exonuclease RecJ [Candidatus Pacebacteria bacterium CG10_big_fil_rev_8_21_14_0_10_40_26]PIZ78293.1 MAG: single-stranded-DNA-specific exonuclease RecJ [Candidatus Pacebacteria bacterium CG_4_10_14_0_2_um_filter_40_20]PJA68662.1 MAG: single-stranded-DNA-specific exonuclease RecJ [Candidatus Pacebacteria bacterium CG_4_9_14_3_um_filter_40_12]PJC41602.1 MAG: single-stranded-DNA-specific exonuclease RecJ [Candidatus Pacebacteria bacterium CG_4_9_14_0_2_um_filter_4
MTYSISMKWQYLSDKHPKTLEDLKSLLLKNRSIKDEKSFFNPTHPLELSLKECGLDAKQLTIAHKRLVVAKSKKEKVVIFGDYDADGITAAATVWLALKEFGLVAQPFIPLRDKHGYGLSVAALEEVIETHNPDLIITVDNGIVAHEAATFLKEKSIDLILTDHHQPEDTLPVAIAVVHSTELCGASVAWMLVRDLLSKEAAGQLLDLVGIATIADQVPLFDANRAFAYHGINALQVTPRRGIKSLLAAATVDQKQLDSTTIGFVLAPRINAMGRLAHGMDALRLLCSQNPQQVAQLTQVLTSTNTERQELTRDLYELALTQAKQQEEEHILVVHSPEFHEGIIGLIAGRLVEKFSKPAIVLSVSEATAKASVRSIPGVHVTNYLRTFKKSMTSLGGHPMAAGFGVETVKMEQLISEIQSEALTAISAEMLESPLTIESQLPVDLVSLELVDVLSSFAPFGSGNDYPIFSLKDVSVLSAKTMGKDNAHLMMTVQLAEDMQPLKIIGWRKARLVSELEIGAKITVVGVIEKNIWRDRVSLQMVLTDSKNG